MWSFVDDTPAIAITIKNVLLERSYPEKENATVLGLLDTGYTGFLYVPQNVFTALRLHQLKTKSAKATLADGSSLELSGSHGSISVPALNNLTIDGLVQTSKGAREILIGMHGIRNLILELNCCNKTVQVEECL